MEREFSKVLEDSSGTNPFFVELKKRMILNSVWESIVGDGIAARAYVCEGADDLLEIWISDPVLGTDLRFMSSYILSRMREKGLEFKKISVKRLRGGSSGNKQ